MIMQSSRGKASSRACKITSFALEGPCNSIKRVDAEMKVFKFLLKSMKQLPSKEVDQHDFVTGFPFIHKPNLHEHVRPTPTGATFMLRLILE